MRRLALLVSAALLAACGARSPEPAPVADAPPTGEILTEGAVPALPDPRLRYPEGSRVVRVDAAGSRTVLSVGLAAAGAPSVAHTADKVLFVARTDADAPFAVYVCRTDGSGRRVAVSHGTDCVRAAFLPDGRVVYAAALPTPSPLAGVARGTALFVAAGDGSPGERITFGAGLDTDPTVLSDGRILLASWRPDEDGGGRLGLFTVHPDGTGYAPFHLCEGDAVYPVQQPDGDVRFGVIRGDAAVERVASWDAPLSVVRDASEARGETVSAAARRRPQGHLSSRKPDVAFGTLVCVDARVPGAASAASVRLATYGARRAELGDAPLADDGSFMVHVPPDTPFVIELLDATGAVTRREHGPLWVRGNEVRVCVGCHDDVETAPPNRRPAAVLGEPVDMTEAAR